PVGGAVEEARAHLLLERGDAPPHGRRIRADLAGGGRERAGAPHGEKVAEIVPVEHSSATLPGWAAILPRDRRSRAAPDRSCAIPSRIRPRRARSSSSPPTAFAWERRCSRRRGRGRAP